MLPGSLFALKLGKGALLKPNYFSAQRNLSGVAIQQDPRDLYTPIYVDRFPGDEPIYLTEGPEAQYTAGRNSVEEIPDEARRTVRGTRKPRRSPRSQPLDAPYPQGVGLAELALPFPAARDPATLLPQPDERDASKVDLIVASLMKDGDLTEEQVRAMTNLQLNLVLKRLGDALVEAHGPYSLAASRRASLEGKADVLELEHLISEIDHIISRVETESEDERRRSADVSSGSGADRSAPRISFSSRNRASRLVESGLNAVSWSFADSPATAPAPAPPPAPPSLPPRWQGASALLRGIFDATIQGGRANDHTFAAYFEALGKCGLMTVAASEFMDMINGSLRSFIGPAAASALLKACMRDVDLQLAVFERMLVAQVPLNEWSFNQVIGTCTGAGRIEDAKLVFSLLHREGDRMNARLDTQTFMQVLKTLDAGKQYFEVMNYYNLMVAELDAPGVPPANPNAPARSPDPQLFSFFISLCGKGGLIREAERIFTDMTELYRLQPGLVTYNSMLQAYGKGGNMIKARELYARMQVQGVQPDSYTAVSLLLAASKAKATLPEVQALWEELCKYRTVVPNTQMLTQLMNCYRACEELPAADRLAKCLALLVLMEQPGSPFCNSRCRPSVQTMNTVLKACEEAEDIATCLKMYERTLALSLEPTAVTLQIMVRFLQNAGLGDLAKDFKDMKKIRFSLGDQAPRWVPGPQAQVNVGHPVPAHAMPGPSHGVAAGVPLPPIGMAMPMQNGYPGRR